MIARRSANPLGMLWPKMETAFVTSGGNGGGSHQPRAPAVLASLGARTRAQRGGISRIAANSAASFRGKCDLTDSAGESRHYKSGGTSVPKWGESSAEQMPYDPRAVTRGGGEGSEASNELRHAGRNCDVSRVARVRGLPRAARCQRRGLPPLSQPAGRAPHRRGGVPLGRGCADRGHPRPRRARGRRARGFAPGDAGGAPHAAAGCGNPARGARIPPGVAAGRRGSEPCAGGASRARPKSCRCGAWLLDAHSLGSDRVFLDIVDSVVPFLSAVAPSRPRRERAELLALLAFAQRLRERSEFVDVDVTGLYRQALDLDPNCGLAHVLFGHDLAQYGGDLEGALPHFARALERADAGELDLGLVRVISSRRSQSFLVSVSTRCGRWRASNSRAP